MILQLTIHYVTGHNHWHHRAQSMIPLATTKDIIRENPSIANKSIIDHNKMLLITINNITGYNKRYHGLQLTIPILR